MVAFRITPVSKPGTGHWEGAPNSYTGALGSEWFELVATQDEGHVVNDGYWDDWDEEIIHEYDDGSSFADDFNTCRLSLDPEQHNFEIELAKCEAMLVETIHHHDWVDTSYWQPVLYDYWDVYKYEFLQWVFQRQERRLHV